MTATDLKLENTFFVGEHKCELVYTKRRGLRTNWTPDLPRRELSEQEWTQYRAGRDALLVEVGKHFGGSVLVIET